MQRRHLLGGLSIGLAALGSRRSLAQAYPARPVSIVSPWAPGGTNDLLARLIAREIAGPLGQPVVVENRPGASGTIGTAFVARARPDGHTITLGSTPNYTTAPALYPNLPYDPRRDFAPVTLVASVPNLLVVTPSLPVHSVAALIDHARAHPGALNYTSVGKGSTQHLCAEMFSSMAGIRMTHVPYNGTAPAMQDLISGRVHLAFENMPPLLPQVRDGGLRALAVTTPRRVSQVPDLPTVAESGLPGYAASVWYAVFAPAGVPEPILTQLQTAIVAALRKPEIIAQLDALGATPIGSTPAELRDYLRIETEKWLGVIRDAGITAD